jgi:hypothetical protein
MVDSGNAQKPAKGMSNKIFELWKNPQMRQALIKMGVTQEDMDKAEKVRRAQGGRFVHVLDATPEHAAYAPVMSAKPPTAAEVKTSKKATHTIVKTSKKAKTRPAKNVNVTKKHKTANKTKTAKKSKPAKKANAVKKSTSAKKANAKSAKKRKK